MSTEAPSGKNAFRKEILRTEKLAKTLGNRIVVGGLDIHCDEGEIIALLGPKGSGKTTSISAISGLVRASSGHIYFQGEDATTHSMEQRARLGMGYLPSEESIFGQMTVEQNIMAILQTRPLPPQKQRRQCHELLARFGLAHERQRAAHALSRAEKFRLSIARSLTTEPRLLLLDEPFSDGDSAFVHEVQQTLRGLRDSGLSILFAEQHIPDALNLADRAYILFEGKIVTQGTKDFLLRPR